MVGTGDAIESYALMGIKGSPTQQVWIYGGDFVKSLSALVPASLYLSNRGTGEQELPQPAILYGEELVQMR
jgi:hypothetical protein